VLLPVLLLSGILLPMTLGAAWLQRVSDFMPIKHVVNGVRASFAGDFASSSVLWGSVWAVALTSLAIWWGAGTFRKENA
jgi:ABC-2 type transport system permease protein